MKRLLMLVAGFLAVSAPAFADTHDSYRLQLDDGQIAEIVLTVNSLSIEAARLALLKSPSEPVRQYAEKMIGEHESVSDSVLRLVKKLNIAPASNPISKSLKADGEADLDRLRSLSGEAFDRAYIKQEIVLYQDVLDTVDNRLMPNATSEELKTVLYNLFAPLSLHLDQAQQIQEALNEEPKGTGTPREGAGFYPGDQAA